MSKFAKPADVVTDDELVELTFNGNSIAADIVLARIDNSCIVAVPLNRRLPSTNQIEVRCPFCRRCHRHGAAGGSGHKLSHCTNPELRSSYYIVPKKRIEIDKILLTPRSDESLLIQL